MVPVSEGGSAASVLVIPVSTIGVVELSLPAGEATDVSITGVVEEVSGISVAGAVEVSGDKLVPELSEVAVEGVLCPEVVCGIVPEGAITDVSSGHAPAAAFTIPAVTVRHDGCFVTVS